MNENPLGPLGVYAEGRGHTSSMVRPKEASPLEVPPRSPGTQRRQDILNQVAGCVCRDRQNTYGDAEDNFADIALRWTNFLQRRQIVSANIEITSADVAAMMIDLKIARLGSAIDHPDNWVDAAGYAVCGGGIIESKKVGEENS